MTPDLFSRLWDDRKSLTLTRWLVLGIGLACAAATLCGPQLVAWLLHRRTMMISGPAVGAVLLVLGYLCAALAFWMLYNLYRFLQRLGSGQVFVEPNVTALRRISWCCFWASVLCLAAGAALYLPFLFLGCAAGFMALLVRVIKNAFAQAVGMKKELDYTV